MSSVYLSASFLFFVGSHLLAHGGVAAEDAQTQVEQPAEPAKAGSAVRLRVKPGATPAETAAAAASAAGAAPRKFVPRLGSCDVERPQTCSRVERWLTRLMDKAVSMTNEQWTARLAALAPYGMPIMQPVFAALLLALFAGSGRRYAEHFVFSLHSHSLWFVALLLATAANAEGLMMLAVFGHGLVALRRVYGVDALGAVGAVGAVWRGLLLSGGYFLLLLLVALMLATAIAATA